MGKIICAEFLKYRRTLIRKIILIAPLFFILVALVQILFMPDDYVHSWELILALVYNWWPVLFIPLGIALFASLIENQEKNVGNYRGLRIRDVSPMMLWVGKITVMVYHTFLATLVLVGVVLISGFLTAKGPIPWMDILGGALVIWFTSLPLIPIQLWIANQMGTIASMVVGVAGFFTGVLGAPNSTWVYIPWSWPTRLMSPLIGVHPNGTFLSTVDPLRDSGVIPVGLTLALGALLIFSWLTAIWFNRGEV